VTANSADPEFTFQVQKPINNEEGHIYGFEIAGQYFLGDTGFGIAGAYTMVEGDVGYDITAARVAGPDNRTGRGGKAQRAIAPIERPCMTAAISSASERFARVQHFVTLPTATSNPIITRYVARHKQSCSVCRSVMLLPFRRGP